MASASVLESEPCKPPSSPWGVPPPAPSAPASLADVMSEQLASHLDRKHLDSHEKEKTQLAEATALSLQAEPIPDLTQFKDDTSDDLLIAQMMQMQFDQEFDANLGMEEAHANKGAKVSVSYEKFRVIPDNDAWEEESDEEDRAYFEQDDRKRPLDLYETKEKEFGGMPRCGYKKVSGGIVTKHDKQLNQRSNGRRIMEFPPGIETGDGGGMDMKLSNGVYNKIRSFSLKEGKRKNRVHDKAEKSTADMAIDPQTRILLLKMINNNVLESVNGIVSSGKEAVIMHADGGQMGQDETEDGEEIRLAGGADIVPKECAVKVFKTSIQEFKKRQQYIEDDYRFKDKHGKWNPRKLVHLWAEKELHNLMKMRKAGIRVPDPVILKNHVLVMSFIGKDGTAALKLKDAHLTKAEWELAYEEVLDTMKRMYDICRLVHADLSEYNILWHEGNCWFIDVSCSVEPNHAQGLEFLYRDCTNITDFFRKKRVHNVPTPEQLFNDITGLELSEGGGEGAPQALAQIRDFEKNQEILTGLADSDKSYPFDYCFEQAKTTGGGMPVAIPGHPKGRQSGRVGGKSPKTSFAAFAPKSPKSPKSPGADFMNLTDEELKGLKEKMAASDSVSDSVDEHPATKVKFAE